MGYTYENIFSKSNIRTVLWGVSAQPVDIQRTWQIPKGKNSEVEKILHSIL